MNDAGAISRSFEVASAEKPQGKPRRKASPPTSIRFSDSEKAKLREWSNGLPIGAYVRTQLFGDNAASRRGRKSSIADYEKLASALALLGQSHLASNMNQLAKAANLGTLPVTLEVVQELLVACQHIRDMREALLVALGVKPESGESSFAKATEDR